MNRSRRVIGGGSAILAVLALIHIFADTAAAVTIRKVQSDLAVTAWYVQDSSVPLIALSFAFRGAGSSTDPEGREGLAALVASLLDEGGGDMVSLEFQRSLEDISGRLSFEAGRDDFFGSLQTLSSEREQAFGLLRTALNNPRFDHEDVMRVQRQILSGLRRSAESSRRIARQTWNRTVFPGHVYGRPHGGTEQSVSSINAKDLRQFVDSRFGRDRLLIAVVGDITEEELSAYLDSVFGSLPATTRPPRVSAVTPAGAGKTVIVRKPNPMSIIMFGHEGIQRDDPDWYAAVLLNQILGGSGAVSRLHQEIREKRGIAYSINTRFRLGDHASLIMGGMVTRNASVAPSLSLIRSEWSRMTTGISEDELRNVKTFANGSFSLRLSSGPDIANMLLAMQTAGLGMNYLNERPRRINAVTLEDANRVARRLFHPDRLTVVVVGDPEDVENTP